MNNVLSVASGCLQGRTVTEFCSEIISSIKPVTAEQHKVVARLNGRTPYDIVIEINKFREHEYKYYMRRARYISLDLYEMIHDTITTDVNICICLLEVVASIHACMCRLSIGEQLKSKYYRPFLDSNEIIDDEFDVAGILVSASDWFNRDYFRGARGKRCYYWNDDYTNYSQMAEMFTDILESFDAWYCLNYRGNLEETSLLVHVNRIYACIQDAYTENVCESAA